MDLLKLLVKLIDDKKGNAIKVIDISAINPLAHYFIICSVFSDTQAVAIADHIERLLLENNYNYHHTEGLHGDRKWVLVDANEVIVHIFVNDEREKYSLDKLWSDQPQIDINEWLN